LWALYKQRAGLIEPIFGDPNRSEVGTDGVTHERAFYSAYRADEHRPGRPMSRCVYGRDGCRLPTTQREPPSATLRIRRISTVRVCAEAHETPHGATLQARGWPRRHGNFAKIAADYLT
jgi:hypothetical protein